MENRASTPARLSTIISSYTRHKNGLRCSMDQIAYPSVSVAPAAFRSSIETIPSVVFFLKRIFAFGTKQGNGFNGVNGKRKHALFFLRA